MFKVGDKVSVVHEDITGKIKDIQLDVITIIDSDGFERKYSSTEIAPISSQNQFKISDEVLDKDQQEKIKRSKENMSSLKKFEIDLHIEMLLKSHSNMTNHEILMKQMESCRRFVSLAIQENWPRVVLIHGKGEGVLKSEVFSYLNKLKYENGYNLIFHEAQFSEYGYGGATEVIFNSQ